MKPKMKMKIYIEADFRWQTSGFLFLKKEVYTFENIKVSNGFYSTASYTWDN
jgi:hypothetical protein